MKNNVFENLKDQLLKLSQSVNILNEQGLSNIEKDLILEKLRGIYDQMLNSETTEKGVEKEELPPAFPAIKESEDLSTDLIDDEIHEEADEEVEIASEELISEQDAPIIKKEESKSLTENSIDLFSVADQKTILENQPPPEPTKDQPETIADKLTRNKIESLKNAIGINEKFFFLNELFNGELNEYNATIEQLDKFETIEDAEFFLLSLKDEKNWDEGSEALAQLQEFVAKKLNP
ncbi:MAG: hypothetical protein K9G76_00120 [Bacteroidales bacterium]|nr:hypothetical protein [Bacteroidales bacterium]MCF8402516.1 hypothetical protein [Bacteroidales bacterium]